MLKLLTTLLFIALLNNVVLGAKESRAKQNFHCNDILNRQLRMEFDASHVYLSLANHFSHDTVALEGFAKMFQHSWKEELHHGEMLIEYMLKRGGVVVTPTVNRPENDTIWSNMNVCQVVDSVLKLEMKVNDHLLKVHKCASGENGKSEDPQLQDFIEANYLEEQVEANKELANLLTRLERNTLHVNSDGSRDYLCEGLGVYFIDQELIKKYSK